MSYHSYILAIDAGTSRIKVALTDDKNNFIDLVSADLQLLHPFEGASEIDMEKMWETLCVLFNQLAERNSRYWKEIAGIGITGQGDGAWLIDKNGFPVCNAILWNDTRTRSTKINKKDELDAYCQENCITPIFQGANYYILKWLKDNRPDEFRRISMVLHCKDWLNFKLTGVLATDYSDTSTAMLNSCKMAYDFKTLEFLELSGTDELFPPIHYSDEVIGYVSPRAAKQTKLKAGIPVIAGSIDIASVASGVGAEEEGDTVAILGTTFCVTMVLQKTQLDYRDRRGSILCHQIRNRYLRLMAMSNGTACLDWVWHSLLPNTPLTEIEKSIQSVDIGSEGVLFQPYLYGERAPFRNAKACGSFLGITAHHNPLHMMRASYEGLIFALSQCYDALPKSCEPLYLSGGGAANNVLCQMVSDTLGKELHRFHTIELGLKGINKTVRRGLGLNFVDLKPLKEDIDIFIPNIENHERYERLAKLYSSAFPKLECWWEERDDFLKS